LSDNKHSQKSDVYVIEKSRYTFETRPFGRYAIK